MPAVSCCLLLLLLGLATAAGQTLEEDSTSLPAESAARVPARLVANARELAGCIDGAPKRCVLKGVCVTAESSSSTRMISFIDA
jgi:hypothetical protein